MVRFVLVGGFLGAGKTTLMARLGRDLAASGQRVALITNDQATDLVDSRTLRALGLPVAEIAGGCFCCRFHDLVRACDELLGAIAPDVVIAEPVGSCADLGATVLAPLKRFYGDRLVPLPYTVLVEPARAVELLDEPGASTPLGYLFGKQLEEADLLAISQVDRLDADAETALSAKLRRRLPATPVLSLSGRDGRGLDDWWQRLNAGGAVGAHPLELDYDAYADAEAELGWLNATVALSGDDWSAAGLATELLKELRRGVSGAAATVGHIKAVVEAGEQAVRANLTGSAAQVEAAGDDWPAATATLTLNARVTLPPDDLQALVQRALRRVCNELRVAPTVERLQCFRPARPTPTYRLETP